MEHVQTLGSIRHLNSWDSVISELEAEYLYSSCQQESRGLITSISSSLNSQFHLGENILVSAICASLEDKVKKDTCNICLLTFQDICDGFTKLILHNCNYAIIPSHELICHKTQI